MTIPVPKRPRLVRCATVTLEFRGQLATFRDQLAAAGFHVLASTWNTEEAGAADESGLFLEALRRQPAASMLLMATLHEHADIAHEVNVLCGQRLIEEEPDEPFGLRAITHSSSVLLAPRAFHFVGIGGLRPDLIRDLPRRVLEMLAHDVAVNPVDGGWLIRDPLIDLTAAIPD